jgi:hypothetical protein
MIGLLVFDATMVAVIAAVLRWFPRSAAPGGSIIIMAITAAMIAVNTAWGLTG